MLYLLSVIPDWLDTTYGIAKKWIHCLTAQCCSAHAPPPLPGVEDLTAEDRPFNLVSQNIDTPNLNGLVIVVPVGCQVLQTLSAYLRIFGKDPIVSLIK